MATKRPTARTRIDLDALDRGLHSMDEARLLYDIAKTVPQDRAIVEVGSYIGVSALWLAAGAEAGGGAHVTCVDKWPQPRANEPDVAHAERQRTALSHFLTNMFTFDWPVTALRIESVVAAQAWLQPIGLLFIDADHSYGAVLADYSLWGPHVAPGGWLVMHDYLGDDMTDDTDVARVVKKVVVPSKMWSDGEQRHKTWFARRIA